MVANITVKSFDIDDQDPTLNASLSDGVDVIIEWCEESKPAWLVVCGTIYFVYILFVSFVVSRLASPTA